MGDVNWRRAYAISSLIFAFMLVCGSIYLHLKQKHHLGRLHHDDKVIVPANGVAATTIPPAAVSATEVNIKDYFAIVSNKSSEESDEDLEYADADVFQQSRFRKAEIPCRNVDVTANRFENYEHEISEACLQCICETATECQPAICDDNEPCGLYRISRPYWIDGGRLRVVGDKSAAKELGPDADYPNCANNAYCSARTIIAYVNKYARDCNSDGIIDCQDYIALHVLGPNGCRMSTLSPLFASRMEQCLLKFS